MSQPQVYLCPLRLEHPSPSHPTRLLQSPSLKSPRHTESPTGYLFSCRCWLVTQLCPTHDTNFQTSLSFTISWSLLKVMSVESVMPSSHLVLCHSPLLLHTNFPSIRVFSNESCLHIRWPKYWSIRFNISPSNEYSALISFRIDWLDPHAIQGTLKSLLQHHSSKESVLRCSAFFMVQLSHPYTATGKITTLTLWTFVGKVMSLLFNHAVLSLSWLV